MLEVTDRIAVRGDASEVFACLWDARLWPEITPHVRRIEMLEETSDHQRFRMTIASGDREYVVETEREAVGDSSITYRQLQPPPFLRWHRGEWGLGCEGGVVWVSLTHRAELDGPKALEILGASSVEEAERIVAEALRGNGALTMNAVKQRVERGSSE